MKLGVTGTRHGPTRAQAGALLTLIAELAPEELGHGDCKGVDAAAHLIARRLGVRVHQFPPMANACRAFCDVLEGEVVEAPAPFLTRDRNLAVWCEVLVAVPAEYRERLHSGTWATVRRGRQAQRTIIVLTPDGNRWNGQIAQPIQ